MPSRRISLAAVAAGMAMTSVAALAAVGHGDVAQWSVQINQVDPGDSNLAPEFKAAIYENLVTELARTKQFPAVLRSGDRNASRVSNLLILKTTVESYAAGSETKRAVTTVAGATKPKVRTQLCTQNGQVVIDRVIHGNVRFFGGNLRATQNLARHVADALKQATLPRSRLPPLRNNLCSIKEQKCRTCQFLENDLEMCLSAEKPAARNARGRSGTLSGTRGRGFVQCGFPVFSPQTGGILPEAVTKNVSPKMAQLLVREQVQVGGLFGNRCFGRAPSSAGNDAPA